MSEDTIPNAAILNESTNSKLNRKKAMVPAYNSSRKNKTTLNTSAIISATLANTSRREVKETRENKWRSERDQKWLPPVGKNIGKSLEKNWKNVWNPKLSSYGNEAILFLTPKYFLGSFFLGLEQNAKSLINNWKRHGAFFLTKKLFSKQFWSLE